MDPTWDAALTIAKFAFIGLIYLVLLGIVIAVRREMQQHVAGTAQAPATSPGRFKVVQRGTASRVQAGQMIPLKPQMTIGAGEDNQLVCDDRFVSGRHARLRWDGTRWLVTDLGSTNGTFVNDQRCPPHRETFIPAGATLQIGDAVFQLLE
jgi:pSer/pThr/pTyr-binding forkhead associated (FHA) protein